MKKWIIHSCLILAVGLLMASSENAVAQVQLPIFGKATTKQVIDAMSIEEKSLMVTGAKRREVVPVALPGRKQKNITAVGGYTYPFIHLGIPSIMLSDGPAGLRIAPKRLNDKNTYYCTAFPVATLVASSWDVELAKNIGVAMGNEALEYGVDILLAPALNIHRDPLGGRSFEYYSEDPLISGKMAAAVVNGIQSQGIGTSIKHFAANNQETSRRTINTVVSERALREIYLEGFRIAVKEAQPWTVMSSYNKINGTYTSQSKELLNDILRKEWGFKGFVLSDWYGGDDAVEQMKAGNELLMPGLAVWSNKIDSALRNKSLDMKVVDQNIERIFNIIQKTSTYKNYPYSNKPDFKAHAKLARNAAAESMILLKNEEATLPLLKSKKIAVFGNYSYKNIPGGTGSGAVNNQYSVSITEGLKNAGYVLDENLEANYINYLKRGKLVDLKEDSLITAMPKPDSVLAELQFDQNEILTSSKNAELAIVTFMRVFGEGGDRMLADFSLTANESVILKSVSEAFRAKGKKVIVLLNIGGVIETVSWRNQADAILLTWQSGQEGGNAVADILSGKVSPSGKLTTTFPEKYADVPSAKNFPGTPIDNPEKVVYEEGIYVGYRYYDSFNIKPAYPFGFGLSYTNFTYAAIKMLGSVEEGLTIQVTIKNNGQIAGREVVQLYVSAPAKSMHKPVKELKAFAKTKLLQPGESETIRMLLSPRSFASFDTSVSAWVAEAGKYQVKVGSSAASVHQTVQVVLPKSLTLEKVHPVLKPKEAINEFIPVK